MAKRRSRIVGPLRRFSKPPQWANYATPPLSHHEYSTALDYCHCIIIFATLPPVGALDLLFPKRCVACKKRGEYVCANCFSRISFAVSPRCLMCEKPSIDGLTHPVCKTSYSIDGCFSAVTYNGIIKKILYTFKYSPYLSDLKHF